MTPRSVAWQVLAAAGGGALVGALVGGLGGRLVMLVLRLGSDPTVLGIRTDDGFEIGRFTTSTLFLITVTAGLGGAVGALYFIVRDALPHRGRAILFAVVVGSFTGADLLRPGTRDFTLLDPKAFAVASFIAMPIVAAFGIALAVDRLLKVDPWSSSALTTMLVIAALPLVPVLPLPLLLWAGAAWVRRRPRLTSATHAVARVVVPLLGVVVAVRSGGELWRDAHEIW